MAATHDIYIDQGTDYGVVFAYQIDAVAVDLTGYAAAMQVRATITDATAVLTLTDGSGITLGGAAGTVAVAITDTATTALTPGGYVYDIELTSGGGDVIRLIQGRFYIDGEVTR